MPEAFRQPSWELQDALAILREREVAPGHVGSGQVSVLWCSPRDARAISRVIVDRSADLWLYLRTAVRLAYAAAAVERRGYAHFFYGRVGALSAAHFRAAFLAAKNGGRVPAGLTVEPQGIKLTVERLLTRSGAGATGFEITYAQMPRLVALLDVLHNTLGYELVADLLAPVTAPGGKQGADEVARALRSAFNTWLGPRLDSQRHRQQAKLIHAFLRARSGATVGPESVNDEAILDFWRDRASYWHARRGAAEAGGEAVAGIVRAEQDEGFRLFRSTVQTLLRYRWCLQDATARHGLEQELSATHAPRHASGIGTSDGRDWSAASKVTATGEGEPSDDATDAGHPTAVIEVADDWWSPLAALSQPPANRIKWLNGKERDWLVNYLGGADDGKRAEGAAEPDLVVGLERDRPFNLAFARTLLRTDVFGAVQGQLLARQRRGEPLATTLQAAMEAIGQDAYETAVVRYREIEQQLRTEALAALAILARADADALRQLLAILAPGELSGEIEVLLTAERPNVVAFRGNTPAPAAPLVELFQRDESQSADVAAFVRQVRKARASVQREGFRKQDEADPGWSRAFVASAAGLARLLGEMRRLSDYFDTHPGAAKLRGDADTFSAIFSLLYR